MEATACACERLGKGEGQGLEGPEPSCPRGVRRQHWSVGLGGSCLIPPGPPGHGVPSAPGTTLQLAGRGRHTRPGRPEGPGDGLWPLRVVSL